MEHRGRAPVWLFARAGGGQGNGGIDHSARIAGQTSRRDGPFSDRFTGNGPLLGRRIEVPALRVDGTKLDVELAITPYHKRESDLYRLCGAILANVCDSARRAAQYAIASLSSRVTAPLIELSCPKILSTIARSGRLLRRALVPDKNGKLVCHSTWGSPERDIDEFESETRRRVFSSGEGLPGRVFVSRAPTWLPSLEAETNFPRVRFRADERIANRLCFSVNGFDRNKWRNSSFQR